ncbi:MAG TPA: M28 family peptidase, partial [Actinomycetes bacterium]|nr:M28 family peptidase [Actinomycetes bacterium]
ADASLILAHGTDAPDPDDPAEPAGLSQRLESVMAGRLSRRSFVGGALGVAGAAALGGPALAAGDLAKRRSPYRGDAESLNTALDEDYLQHVTASLVAFGDTPSGWRPGGSPANLQAVDWIAAEMKRVGMKKVAKLPVPIDRWVFNGASVSVDGGATVFEASSWGGVPGTAPGGITAEVIDIGTGFAADYEGIDATGKIVLVDWQYGDIWVNRHGHQATLEGALAIIFYTGTTSAGAFYNTRDDGLMSFDGTYNDDWVPFVFVTRTAANDLRARIAAGSTVATLISNVELTRAGDGGVGYNVLGAIPGTDRADEYVIFTGHHDAWFRGAADDATAIAAMLGIAKAIRDTGFRSRRTLLFLASTNEEYGYTDAYYEWLIGCWYAVTHQNPKWQRRAILTLDFELLGTGDPQERLLIRTHSELLEHAKTKLLADPTRTPYGAIYSNVVWANADHFTLTAAGIPGLYFNTVGTQYLTRNYHTNFDVLSAVDFGYLRLNLEVINDIWVDHDRSSLPILDFVLRAEEAAMRIAFVVDGKTVRDLPGADQGAQDGLEAAVARFREAAQALEDRLAAGPVKALRRVGSLMMGAERRVLRELVALDIFDQYIFPHQQVQRDATRMQLAIDALGAGNPVAALDLVRRTGLTSAGRRFAYETYTAELERHDPGFDALQWGGQAHLAPYVDVWQEYHSIAGKIDDGFTASGDYAAEIASLTAKVGPVYARLNERLGRMTEVFDASTGDLRRALRMAR